MHRRREADRLELLIVATKAPWPPIDGGRLLLLLTLRGLAAEGLRPTLVAPVDPRQFALDEVAAELDRWCAPRLLAVRPMGRFELAAKAFGSGVPLSIARHALPAVRRAVDLLLARQAFDLVHAEQLQAFAQTAPGRDRGLPVVLRAQNVESDLWAAAGARRLLAAQARLLAAWEGRAVDAADLTLAVSAADAERLACLAAGGERPRIAVLPPPFPPRLETRVPSLSGAPAVVFLGSRGWPPNDDALAWFRAEIWPEVRRALPSAALHVFGVEAAARSGEENVHWHPAPPDSATAFAGGSIQIVPLRFGSGVRMKVLEAWARGVPVVATAEAVAGLAAEDGRDVLVARDAAAFAGAIGRLHRDPALVEALVRGGHEALRRRHDPRQMALRLIAAYEGIVARRAPADSPA